MSDKKEQMIFAGSILAIVGVFVFAIASMNQYFDEKETERKNKPMPPCADTRLVAYSNVHCWHPDQRLKVIEGISICICNRDNE